MTIGKPEKVTTVPEPVRFPLPQRREQPIPVPNWPVPEPVEMPSEPRR